ncbi:hypothetical protein C8J57DRAFT_1343141 [Mycena rebaudengoi]|nr:hypothetical protein C8J57DRAFT_1343141 [Mycena rebaudengoi]
MITLLTDFLVLQPTDLLSAAHLSMIITHLVLPQLRTLDLRTDTLDPVVLSKFLHNHPSIREIVWSRSDGDKNLGAVGVLCDPPSTLPSLIHLRTNNGFALAALLDALDAPRMSIIALEADRSTPLHVAGLKAGLRRLSFFTRGITIELNTSLTSWGVLTQVCDQERLLVGALYCVERVHLMNANLKVAQSVLSWFAMLPALRALELRLDRSIRLNCDESELAGFMDAARAALPGVDVADRSLH